MQFEIGEQFEMTHGYFMELNGWSNCWDAMPEKEGTYLVEDHSGKQGKAEAVLSFGRMAWKVPKWCGYDICWWKEIINERKTKSKEAEKRA